MTYKLATRRIKDSGCPNVLHLCFCHHMMAMVTWPVNGVGFSVRHKYAKHLIVCRILPVSRKEVIHWPTMEVKCPTVEGDEKYMEQALHGNDLFGDQVYGLRSESTQFEEVENMIQRNLKVSSHETIMTDIEGNISQDACGDAKAGNNIANDQDLLEPDSDCARTRKDLRAQSEEGSQGIVNLSPSDSESNQSLWNPAMQPKVKHYSSGFILFRGGRTLHSASSCCVVSGNACKSPYNRIVSIPGTALFCPSSMQV